MHAHILGTPDLRSRHTIWTGRVLQTLLQGFVDTANISDPNEIEGVAAPLNAD
jgi:hypothetical protein